MKPSTCIGCEWYDHGQSMVMDSPAGQVLILFGHPSKSDVELNTLGISSAGKDLETSFIPLAGLTRGESCGYAAAVKCRPTGKDIPLDKIPMSVQQHCSQHLAIPPTTTLIVAIGKAAFDYAHGGLLRAPDGKSVSIEDWRGFIIPNQYTQPRFGNVPVYVTHHPSDMYTNPAAEHLTYWDWIKVKRILDGTYPKAIPPSLQASADTISQVIDWFTQAESAQWIVCDTEFIPATEHLTVLGLLARFADGRLSPLQVDWRTADGFVKHEVGRRLAKLVKTVKFVFHNCRADIPVLEKACGIWWSDYIGIEDTMLAHAVVWCELPHSLEFIASLWGEYPKLKHLKNNDEMLYNLGDCLETDSIWYNLEYSSFKHDKAAEQVYRTQHLKLAPLVERSVRRGLRVNKARVLEARMEYEAAVQQARQLATACAGWPINLNSNRQLVWYLYHIRGLPARFNKDSGNPTIDDSAIAALRMELGPAFDPDEDLTYERALQRINAGADPILEARVLYAGAQTRLIKYIYSLYEDVAKVKAFNYSTKGAYEAARDKAIESVLAGTSTAILDRIHPDMLIHTQKTGRWSTVDPPIAQLPADLRDLVCPDIGEVWISWDWASIEPRVLEALCRSRILRRSFDEGIDLHTWTTCMMFHYDMPPNLIDPHKSPECAEWRVKYKWKGKDDPRRVFAKTGRYEMYYGGTGANAAEAAALFGLNPKDLKRALAGLLAADPEYYAWRLQLESDLKRTRMVRTFMGRPRRFLRGGDKMIREGLDQPMQGAVSDIANTTVVMLSELGVPGFQFGWSMHDSQKWHCPEALVNDTAFIQAVRSIAEREHIINGRATKFPIDMEIVYPPEHGNKHVHI